MFSVISRKTKKLENARRESDERASDGMFIIGGNGVIEYVNPAFEAMTDFQKHELVGKSSDITNLVYHANAFHNQLWSFINENGIGICKDNITKLFKEFSQTEQQQPGDIESSQRVL